VSRFGPDPRTFFESIYEGVAPWDVGEAQPALTELFSALPPKGPVLDVGCGPGDLAIALARLDLAVLGVDFAESAIALAREKVASLPADVAHRLGFRVGDALRPSAFGRDFGAVVDSGFLHLFDLEERDVFAVELANALRPGGRYYLLAFAVTFPVPHSPREVSVDELRSRFSAEQGWLVRDCRQAEFQSRVGPVPAIRACIEREETS
jgi:SAM-dependent methyltransferase